MSDGTVIPNSAPNRFTSRKFVLAMLAVQSCSALMWYGKIDGGVYSAVMIAIIGAYFAANVTQKATSKPS